MSSGSIPQQQQPPPHPAQYMSQSAHKHPRILACVLCQHRKIKCDRNTPCSNCVKVMPLQSSPPSRRPVCNDNHGHTQMLTDIISRPASAARQAPLRPPASVVVRTKISKSASPDVRSSCNNMPAAALLPFLPASRQIRPRLPSRRKPTA